MIFQFLGTAAATSVPLVFCNCELCKQARINKGKDIRKRASAIINNELLIDLGPDICSQAEMYNIDLSNIKYLLQTRVFDS
jgi:phosphoribosyl 1,2-cyclic phosphodiesterase